MNGVCNSTEFQEPNEVEAQLTFTEKPHNLLHE